MSTAALVWIAGLLVGFLLATVFFLRRQVTTLRARMLKLEAVAENHEARLFVLEEEFRWLASQVDQYGEAIPEN